MSITGYFDQQTKDIEPQIEMAKQLDIKGLSLRYFNDQTLLNIDQALLKELPLKLKKDKMSIFIIDAMYHYPLVTINKVELTTLFQNAEALGTKYLVLSLPVLTSFDLQHDDLITHLKALLEETKKKHFELVFKVGMDYAVGQIAYIINEIKNIKFVFDASLIYKQGASVTTSYRILKNNIQILSIYDVDKQNEPYLLGLGASNIVDVLKKAHRDKYKGLYLMDNNLNSYIENRKEIYQQKKVLWIFSKNKKERLHYQRMDQKLHIKDTDELTLIDMHKVYLSIIKKVIE